MILMMLFLQHHFSEGPIPNWLHKSVYLPISRSRVQWYSFILSFCIGQTVFPDLHLKLVESEEKKMFW